MPRGIKVEIEPFDILFRELKIVGSFVNPFTHGRAADLIASGAIKVAPLISRTIGLGEVAEAIKQPPLSGEIRVLAVPGSWAVAGLP